MCDILLLILLIINIGLLILVRLLLVLLLVLWVGLSIIVGFCRVVLIVNCSVFCVMLLVILVILIKRVCCLLGNVELILNI